MKHIFIISFCILSSQVALAQVEPLRDNPYLILREIAEVAPEIAPLHARILEWRNAEAESLRGLTPEFRALFLEGAHERLSRLLSRNATLLARVDRIAKGWRSSSADWDAALYHYRSLTDRIHESLPNVAMVEPYNWDGHTLYVRRHAPSVIPDILAAIDMASFSALLEESLRRAFPVAGSGPSGEISTFRFEDQVRSASTIARMDPTHPVDAPSTEALSAGSLE